MAKPKLRKMLGDVNSPEVTKLMRLIETQSLKTLANWAIEYARDNYLPIFEAESPGDGRPRAALNSCRAYLQGELPLNEARKSISDATAAAREQALATAQAAARAIATACAVIRTPTSALAICSMARLQSHTAPPARSAHPLNMTRWLCRSYNAHTRHWTMSPYRTSRNLPSWYGLLRAHNLPITGALVKRKTPAYPQTANECRIINLSLQANGSCICTQLP